MRSAAFAAFEVLVRETYSQLSNTVRVITYSQSGIHFLKV